MMAPQSHPSADPRLAPSPYQMRKDELALSMMNRHPRFDPADPAYRALRLAGMDEMRTRRLLEERYDGFPSSQVFKQRTPLELQMPQSMQYHSRLELEARMKQLEARTPRLPSEWLYGVVDNARGPSGYQPGHQPGHQPIPAKIESPPPPPPQVQPQAQPTGLSGLDLLSAASVARSETPVKPATPPAAAGDYLDDITDLDVLCGRGGRSNHHAGNIRYRRAVDELKSMYRTADIKSKKTDLSRAIVAYVFNYGGRFVKEEFKTGRYRVLSRDEARKKTSQALRETKKIKWTVKGK